jgi:putative membrane protein
VSLRSYRTFQMLILGALGVFLLFKLYDGQVLMYVNRRSIVMVLLAALAFLAIAQELLRDRPAASEDKAYSEQDLEASTHTFSGWNLWWLGVPLLLGLLIPARPLGSTAAATRGINNLAPLAARSVNGLSQAASLPPEQRSILDWLQLFQATGDLKVLATQTVDVDGFVYHDPRLTDGRFMVGRFAITCCVADAMAIGMTVVWPDSAALPDNGWVRVRGQIQVESAAGKSVPYVAAAEVLSIPEPQQPYLYP